MFGWFGLQSEISIIVALLEPPTGCFSRAFGSWSAELQIRRLRGPGRSWGGRNTSIRCRFRPRYTSIVMGKCICLWVMCVCVFGKRYGGWAEEEGGGSDRSGARKS